MSKILALQMLAAGGDLVAAESTSSVNCFAGDSFNSNCSVNCGGKTVIDPVDTTVAV
ncbi:MAG: hypothetical protein LAO78_14890 [Acidobacteriia bacterium]|nr:hypothetical protein [Terriglobia bacterium]